MLFTDPQFYLFFLPITLFALWLSLRVSKGQFSGASYLVIALATLFFYGSQSAWYLLPLGISIGCDFLWATLLFRTKDSRIRKLICTLSICQNIAILALFKFRPFWLSLLGGNSEGYGELAWLPKELPPGISFYTFESMSFVIDIYRGQIAAPVRPREFFGFLLMFPRFIAGPIVRFSEMLPQYQRFQGMHLGSGFVTFAFGFALKRLFADNFAHLVPLAFENTSPSGLESWLGVFGYTFQIYFDFSGYSLMAIGLGKMLGFQFPANFNRPYLASSLQDFWRRWHITLSSWLRDYVYFSLGGNRCGKWRTYLNLLITMAVGGVWHGGTVSFLIWGLWHGSFLVIERQIWSEDYQARWRTVFTFFIVMWGWVFFRADTLKHAARIFHSLLFFGGTDSLVVHLPQAMSPEQWLLIGCGLVYCFVIERNWESLMDRLEKLPPFFAYSTSSFLIAMSVDLSSNSLLPFLYFQF